MAQNVDLGIDFGTSSVVICDSENQVILHEPAVISIVRSNNRVLAVGDKAAKMIGRAPAEIQVIRPLQEIATKSSTNLVIMAATILGHFVEKAIGKRHFGGPRVVLSVPSIVDERDRSQLLVALYEENIKRSQMLKRPTAAAIGAEMNIREDIGQMIVDVGGGTTEIAVFAKGDLFTKESYNDAGDSFDKAIIDYIKRKYSTLIGEVTAEDLKCNIASAVPRKKELSMEVVGRNLLTGLPKVLTINSSELYDAIEAPLQKFLECIYLALEKTPASLATDILSTGITLSGGGAKLFDISRAVEMAMNLPCRLVYNPEETVARGCARALVNTKEFGQYLSSN